MSKGRELARICQAEAAKEQHGHKDCGRVMLCRRKSRGILCVVPITFAALASVTAFVQPDEPQPLAASLMCSWLRWSPELSCVLSGFPESGKQESHSNEHAAQWATSATVLLQERADREGKIRRTRLEPR